MDTQQGIGRAPTVLYSPLNHASREIRLLEIVSSSSDGTWDDAVTGGNETKCKLHTAPLGEAPCYVALSYVWGDESITEDIVVNGQIMPVTVNLASALRHVGDHWQAMRPNGPRLRVWADAICINQLDLDEKASQVQFMRQIYESAQVTFAWLSSDDGAISEVIDLLYSTYGLAARYATQPLRGTDSSSHWRDDVRSFTSRVDWYRFIPAWLALNPFGTFYRTGDETLASLKQSREPWASLERMYRLPYWERVWVLQEAIVSREYYLLSPSRMIDSVTALMAFEALNRALSAPTRLKSWDDGVWALVKTRFVEDMQTVQSFLNRRWLGSATPEPFSEEMSRCQLFSTIFLGNRRLSTDPLDQVYGVLGYTGIDMTLDYHASVGQVYLDFAHKFVYETGTKLRGVGDLDARLGLSFLNRCAAGIGNSHDLPSWAPAFRLSRLEYLACFERYDTDVAVLPDTPRVLSAGRSLWSPGARVQPVSKCTAAGAHQRPCEETIRLFEDVLASLGSTYVTGMLTVEALARVLMMRPTGNVNLAALESCFRHRWGWKASSGLLYEQFKAKNSRFPTLAESHDQPTRYVTLGLYSLFLADWVHNHPEAFTSFQLIETVGKYLGLAGEDAREGDVVYMLKGCSTPVLLRHEGGYFLFVGPCFVLGPYE